METISKVKGQFPSIRRMTPNPKLKKLVRRLISLGFLILGIFFGLRGVVLHSSVGPLVHRFLGLEGQGQLVPPPKLSDNGEYFTSVIGMKQLVRIEQEIVKEMVQLLDNFDFKNSEQRKKWRVKLIRKWVKRYLNDYDSSIRPYLLKSRDFGPEVTFKWPLIVKNRSDLDYLEEAAVSHPLIAFRMIRRLFVNFNEGMMEHSRYYGLMSLWQKISPPVTSGDLIGAAEGILRLKETFLMSPYDFTQGILANYPTKSGLLATDAVTIGNCALEEKDNPKVAFDWFLRAFRLTLNYDTSIDTVTARTHLLHAIDKHNSYLSSNPSKTFSLEIDKNVYNPEFDSNLRMPQPTPQYSTDQSKFDALCRSEDLRAPSLTKGLKCYLKQDSPYLVVKPLKVEVYNEDPPIHQIYDILPPSLLEHFRNLASEKDKLRRAFVLNSDKKTMNVTGTVPSKIRIASNAWFPELQDEKLGKARKLMEEGTELDMGEKDGAEQAQVAVYGSIGGYYLFHYDTLFDPQYYLNKNKTEEDVRKGDRIATLMFYLSDIKMGEGTAFPRLGLVSRPVKGSAMFWFNLKKNGERHDDTLHGGCPVLLGEKWVVNKWIHSGAQMFNRKCDLDPKL